MELILVTPPRERLIRPVLLDDNEQVVQLVSHYLKTLLESAHGYSLKTIKLYGNNLRYLCEWLASDDQYRDMPMDLVLASIPSGVINQYLVRLRQNGKQGTTAKNRDITYKGFFEWLTTAEAGNVRKTSGYEKGLNIPSASSRKMPRFVTKEQVIVLINAVYHESLRCALHLIYDAGLRVSEICRISKEDVDLLDCWPERFAYLPLLIKGSKGRGGNNIKERYVLISRAVYERIKRYHNTPSYRFAQFEKAKPAFLNTQRGAISIKGIQKIVSSAAKRAKFPPGTISPHRLRHGTALTFLQGPEGQDYLEKLVLIQIQFGHSSIRSTEAYSRIPPSLFTKIEGNEEVKERFQEAQDIYEKTYLPIKNYKEWRGRKRKC